MNFLVLGILLEQCLEMWTKMQSYYLVLTIIVLVHSGPQVCTGADGS